jgi:tetratricopeptide (TPR) repeat protein
MTTILKMAALAAALTFPFGTECCAQVLRGGSAPDAGIGLLAWAAGEGDPQDDAGYALYRKGYRQILEEQWEAAQQVFAKLVASHPRSRYVDDAQYWSAYALMHTDREKALTAYRTFVEQHRSSSYYTDAIADMNQLKVNMALAERKDPFVTVTRPDAAGTSYYIAVAPHVKGIERQIRISRGGPGPFPPGIAAPPAALQAFQGRGADPELEFRIQVVTAIGRGREDEKSFETLRDIIVDRQQPNIVRIVAINSIAGFTKHDALPVLVEVARADTNIELQNTAIEFIGQAARDKNRSVEALEEIFQSLPPDRTDQLATTLFAIADVGNDRAVDVLARVAKSNPNYDLRSDAVFYLGSIGSEKARAALVDLIRGK